MTPYLTVDAWFNYVKGKGVEATVAEAKATPIHVLDDSHEEKATSSAFECFGYEASLDSRPYILSSGVWYEVVPDFLARINGAVAKLKPPEKQLLMWDKKEHEGEYNARCGAVNGFTHFDKKSVPYGGGQSRFEFCDVAHLKSRSLYFVKIASKSSGMSHLLEQVRRTSELFFSADAQFRRTLQKSIIGHDKKADIGWLETRPKPGEWNLCLVSMGRAASRLPFFAKCGLVKAVKDIQERGHDVFFQAV